MKIRISNTHTGHPVITTEDKEIEIELVEMSVKELADLSCGCANLIGSVNSQIVHRNMTKTVEVTKIIEEYEDHIRRADEIIKELSNEKA